MSGNSIYSGEPGDKKSFTEGFDQFYTRYAHLYDWFIKIIPIWRNWLQQAIPHIEGERVLEISFGTGYLLTRYANRFQTYGIDYNKRMATLAKNFLERRGVQAYLQVANVEALPYGDETFNTIVNTMAFTGYPDGKKALVEMYRVLKPGGCLLMIDINYPGDRNRFGTFLTKAWASGGDIIRDMGRMFGEFGFQFTDVEIGGFGSVHLYVAKRA